MKLSDWLLALFGGLYKCIMPRTRLHCKWGIKKRDWEELHLPMGGGWFTGWLLHTLTEVRMELLSGNTCELPKNATKHAARGRRPVN